MKYRIVFIKKLPCSIKSQVTQLLLLPNLHITFAHSIFRNVKEVIRFLGYWHRRLLIFYWMKFLHAFSAIQNSVLSLCFRQQFKQFPSGNATSFPSNTFSIVIRQFFRNCFCRFISHVLKANVSRIKLITSTV